MLRLALLESAEMIGDDLSPLLLVVAGAELAQVDEAELMDRSLLARFHRDDAVAPGEHPLLRAEVVLDDAAKLPVLLVGEERRPDRAQVGFLEAVDDFVPDGHDAPCRASATPEPTLTMMIREDRPRSRPIVRRLRLRIVKLREIVPSPPASGHSISQDLCRRGGEG